MIWSVNEKDGKKTNDEKYGNVVTLPKNRNRSYFVLLLTSCNIAGISLAVSSCLLLILDIADFQYYYLNRKKQQLFVSIRTRDQNFYYVVVSSSNVEQKKKYFLDVCLNHTK